MKNKIFFGLLLSVMFFGLCSCSKDDDKEPESATIVGSWSYDAGGVKLMYRFNQNGTGAEIYVFGLNDFTTEKFTWTLNDKKVIMTYLSGEGANTFTIKSLSSKEMVAADSESSLTFKKVSDSETDKYLR